ncbi:MAG: hypothetical protein R3E31_18515 [Chloroflexota bacterium]
MAALHGGLILAVHDEADWHIEPISLPAQQVIIVLPDFDFPTAAARAALPDSLPRADAIFNHSRLPLLLRALETADYAKLALGDARSDAPALSLAPGAGLGGGDASGPGGRCGWRGA